MTILNSIYIFIWICSRLLVKRLAINRASQFSLIRLKVYFLLLLCCWLIMKSNRYHSIVYASLFIIFKLPTYCLVKGCGMYGKTMWPPTEYINFSRTKIFNFRSFLFSPYPTNFSTLIVVLYCCIGIFAFAVMLLFFVGLKLNKKKIENSWLVWGLKVIINLFLSVLYLPIIDTFVSIINCNTINDTQYHALFGSELCW